RFFYYGRVLHPKPYLPRAIFCYRCYKQRPMQAFCPQCNIDPERTTPEGQPRYRCGLCKSDDHDMTAPNCPMKQKATARLRQTAGECAPFGWRLSGVGRQFTGTSFARASRVGIAESLLKKFRGPAGPEVRQKPASRPVVVPYLHALSHNVKRVANKFDVPVVFSAPRKLSRLCTSVNRVGPPRVACDVNHRTHYVTCATGVVYQIPLSCGRVYIGSTDGEVHKCKGEGTFPFPSFLPLWPPRNSL
ncbi:hypothetical protein HPB47_011561, partial [Ixodes persulcatus]